MFHIQLLCLGLSRSWGISLWVIIVNICHRGRQAQPRPKLRRCEWLPFPGHGGWVPTKMTEDLICDRSIAKILHSKQAEHPMTRLLVIPVIWLVILITYFFGGSPFSNRPSWISPFRNVCWRQYLLPTVNMSSQSINASPGPTLIPFAGSIKKALVVTKKQPGDWTPSPHGILCVLSATP